MEVDLVDGPLVLGEDLLLLGLAGLAEVPHDHGTVSRGRGDQAVVDRRPDHVVAAVVEVGVLYPEVCPLYELVLLHAVDLEDGPASHHHLEGTLQM